ncbi:MAG: multidrug efflux MFS transporter [Chloroflexi bacterium]|nr:MAG: multidrug efflux MFS transporter [Chloroflexota bacterium]
MSAALARIDPRFTSRASSITNSLQRVSSSIGIAVLVTILAAQFTTAAQQTACTPSQSVLSTASVREHHAVTQVEFCGQLRASFSNLQVQGGGSTSAQARPPFVKAFGDKVLSTSFDRTFAFIAIITLIGVIPAFFLKKPDKKRSVAVAA